MKRIETEMKLLIQIALLTLAGLVIYSCAGVPTGPAKPQFDSEDFNFGRIPKGSTVTHVYKLTNAGGDSVLVQRIRPHCGCTKAPLQETVAHAGETIPIELRFNSGGYRGKAKKSATITLFLAEENTPNYRLMFSTYTDTTSDPFSYGELGASPYKIEFSDSMEYVDITLTNRVAAKREVKVVDYQPDRVKLSWEEKTIGPKEEETLRVTRLAESHGIVASITLEMTDHPNTRITIPISEYVARGSIRTGSSVSRRISIPESKDPWKNEN